MGADDPVRLVPDVALEHAEGAVGPRAEEAVFLPAVEPERIQHPLEFAYVVSSEHRGSVVQGPVAEPPASLHELLPGIGTDEAVHLQMPFLLEPADRGLGARSEGPDELRAFDVGAERRQPRLDVGDLRTAVARVKDAHRIESAWAHDTTATGTVSGVGRRSYTRCGSRSRRIASFGRAPVTRTTSLPALNRISDGIDITP